jgi:hypothetical protein
MGNFELSRAHGTEIERLSSQVDSAFSCRPIVDLTADGSGTLDLIEANQELFQRLKYFKDSYTVIVNRPQLLPHQIETTSLDDLSTLLLLAATRVAQSNHYPDYWAPWVSEKLFNHEKKHASVFNQRPDVGIGFKVQFLTDRKTKLAAFLPTVFVYGKIEVDLLKKFFRAPKDKSLIDKAFGRRFKG